MRMLSRLWTLAALASVPVLVANIGPASPSPWQADLAFLRSKLAAMHPNPFRRLSASAFNDAAGQLDRELAGASKEQAIVGTMRLVASLEDGHTSVLPGPQLRAGFHVLPLRFYLYGEDFVLDGADRAYVEGLGGTLISIDGVPANEVLRRVREVTPGDNASTVNGRLPSYVVVPEVLAGLGVIRSPAEPVQVGLKVGDETRTLSVQPGPPPQDHAPPGITTTYSKDWISRGPKQAPLWLRNANKPYWFDYLPKERALYLQYNNCISDPANPMHKFAELVKQEIIKRQPRRIIIDLRLNPGGEGYWNRFLVRALLRSDAAGEKDRFFVLIGRQTFSAGNMMAVELEKYAAATFVGEPSGGSVQGFGNHEPIFLPNSGLGVMIATKFYQNNGPNDDRPTITPQIPVQMTADDYGAGRDPVLEAALRLKG